MSDSTPFRSPLPDVLISSPLRMFARRNQRKKKALQDVKHKYDAL